MNIGTIAEKPALPGWLRLIAAASAIGLLATACSGDEQGAEPDEAADEWPTETISFILPTAPGGGADTTARELQPYIEENLGTSISIESREGGNHAVAVNAMLDDGQECDAFALYGVPHVIFSYLTQDVDYSLESMHPVGGITIEPGVIRVPDDSPWETLDDLIEEARQRPGELRTGVSGVTDSNHFGLLDIEQETGVEFNIVPYDGGGPARNALVAGEIDFVHAGAFNSLGIADETRVIAVHQDTNDWPDITDDAPTVKEALGADIRGNSSSYGLFVSAECADQYPDRHEKLVEAVEQAQQNPDYLEDLAATDSQDKVRFVAPDEYQEMLLEEEEAVTETLANLGELVE